MLKAWSIYFVLGVSVALSLALPFALSLISRLLGASRKSPAPPPKAVGDSAPIRRTAFRYASAVNASLVLVMTALLLLPCLGLMDDSRGAILVFSIVGVLGAGLLYSIKKGDLDWERP